MSDLLTKILDILPYELNQGNATTEYDNFSITRKSNTFILNYDGSKYSYGEDTEDTIELELEEDLLEKIGALVNKKEFPYGILIPIDMTTEEAIKFKKFCDEHNINFEDYLNEIVSNLPSYLNILKE